MIDVTSAPFPVNPEFDPDDLELADLFPGFTAGDPSDPEAPAVIRVGLNPADLGYVYVAIDPAGEPVLARQHREFRFTEAVWADLHPAEARELGQRLHVLADAATRFLEDADDEGVAGASPEGGAVA